MIKLEVTGASALPMTGNADAKLFTINCSLLLDVIEQHVDDGSDVADVEAAVEVQVG